MGLSNGSGWLSREPRPVPEGATISMCHEHCGDLWPGRVLAFGIRKLRIRLCRRRIRKETSYNHHSLQFRATYHRQRDGSVEGRQPSAILHGKRKQVDVRQLLRAKNTFALEYFLVNQRDIIWPENMALARSCRLQQSHCRKRCHRIRITWLRKDAYKTILCDRTGGPPPFPIEPPPFMSTLMMHVPRIE